MRSVYEMEDGLRRFGDAFGKRPKGNVAPPEKEGLGGLIVCWGAKLRNKKRGGGS